MEHESDVVRRPLAWRIRPGGVPAHAAPGGHCEGRRGTRRCQDPVAVVTWRWWRSAEAGRVLVSERFLCGEHAAEFAARHRIEIAPSPPERSTRDSGPGHEDEADEDEPYCATCGAGVGIFIGHGEAWLHYTGQGTVADPVELYDAGHAPDVAWRPAGAP